MSVAEVREVTFGAKIPRILNKTPDEKRFLKITLGTVLLVLCLLVACTTLKNAPNPPVGNTPPIGAGSCSVTQEWCQGSCVERSTFLNDSGNCGSCGHSCSISESCTGGSCSCSPGSESCMGRCVSSASFLSDTNNCGRCGNACAIGQSCFGGMCQKF